MQTRNRVLVDTCIWIEFFRTKSDTSDKMRDLIANDRVVVTGIILAELLQGVKGKKEQKIIEGVFNTLDYVEMTKAVWLETGIVSKKLRLTGCTIPLSDISIACLARQNNFSIFTIDKHFNEIPDVVFF